MLNTLLNKVFPDRGLTLYKPNDSGLIILPNGIIIKATTREGNTGDIQQVIEVNGEFFSRRKVNKKWVCDAYPLVVLEPVSKEEYAPIEPQECEWVEVVKTGE